MVRERPTMGEDKVIWLANLARCFNIKTAWEEFCLRKEKVKWNGLVWFKKHD